MKKLWGKIIKENRIKKDCVIEVGNVINFFENLKEVCYILQIETPIILKKHIKEIQEFNTTTFKSSDFIDFINFDAFKVEYFEV